MKTSTAITTGIAIGAALAAMGVMLIGSTTTGCTSSEEMRTERRPHETSIPALPEKADFCGEEMPMERDDIRESFEREIVVNTFLHSATLQNIKKSGRYFPVIESILAEMGMPDDLKYLCVAESNLMPTIGSPAGARGIWQFMEATAKEYGLTVTNEIDERLDVEKSTRAACMLLRENYSRLGSWTMAAAAYNCGLGGARKRVETQHQENYYDILWADETARYVFRIIAIKTILSSPEKYGFNVSEEDKYEPIETRTETLVPPQEDLAQWAINHGSTYKELRTLNPWITKSYLKQTRAPLTVVLRK